MKLSGLGPVGESQKARQPRKKKEKIEPFVQKSEDWWTAWIEEQIKKLPF
jgi:hypothetical protein